MNYDNLPAAVFCMLFGAGLTCLFFALSDLLWKYMRAKAKARKLASTREPRAFEIYEDRWSGWRCVVLRCNNDIVWYVIKGYVIHGQCDASNWHRDWIRVLP